MATYAWDADTLARADEHGCLDEDVVTGDPVVCAGCAHGARWESVFATSTTQEDGTVKVIVQGKSPGGDTYGAAFLVDPASGDPYRFGHGMRRVVRMLEKAGIQ